MGGCGDGIVVVCGVVVGGLVYVHREVYTRSITKTEEYGISTAAELFKCQMVYCATPCYYSVWLCVMRAKIGSLLVHSYIWLPYVSVVVS